MKLEKAWLEHQRECANSILESFKDVTRSLTPAEQLAYETALRYLAGHLNQEDVQR